MGLFCTIISSSLNIQRLSGNLSGYSYRTTCSVHRCNLSVVYGRLRVDILIPDVVECDGSVGRTRMKLQGWRCNTHFDSHCCDWHFSFVTVCNALQCRDQTDQEMYRLRAARQRLGVVELRYDNTRAPAVWAKMTKFQVCSIPPHHAKDQ
eukprot:757377-Hanusia_phi.AAC.1